LAAKKAPGIFKQAGTNFPPGERTPLEKPGFVLLTGRGIIGPEVSLWAPGPLGGEISGMSSLFIRGETEGWGEPHREGWLTPLGERSPRFFV